AVRLPIISRVMPIESWCRPPTSRHAVAASTACRTSYSTTRSACRARRSRRRYSRPCCRLWAKRAPRKKPHSYSTQPPPRYPLATVVGREISRRSVAQDEKASLARLDASEWHERKRLVRIPVCVSYLVQPFVAVLRKWSHGGPARPRRSHVWDNVLVCGGPARCLQLAPRLRPVG